MKRSFHSVTISFEIGDLDRSVRVERSLISVGTCSCGRVRDWTLRRYPLPRAGNIWHDTITRHGVKQIWHPDEGNLTARPRSRVNPVTATATSRPSSPLCVCSVPADVLGSPVVRPANIETTALGAAYAAGLAVGVWTEDEIFSQEKIKNATMIRPAIDEELRKKKLQSLAKAIERTFDLADLSL
ncbi:hypothetical protein CRG98_033885 [Punica granatum]|uniref:Uncharacterized protein n=1 Tax=Punica granatum TaxID=22663 RepID=A0A2I0IP27_PUNGR|nr:hypothetical protein CRG98_033885 [Punica granatum]